MHAIRELAVALAATWAVGCQPRHRHAEEEKATFAVTTPIVENAEIDTEYVAQIRAIQHIELRALERGYLTEIFVDEGQLIEKGKKMFQILPRLYEAEVRRAQAERDLAKIEVQNTAMLAEKDIVSPPELAMAKAKLDMAKAELSLAETHRMLTEVRAPFTGLMGRFEVRLGSLVEEGELLTTLSDNRTVWVYFNVNESEYLEYQSAARSKDTPLPVKLRMANGKIFDQPGKVETIEADFNSETGNIAFRAAFPNPNGLLRHGETGNALLERSFPNALIIPQKATFEILDHRYVFVVDESGVVSSRKITISAELPHLFIVASGLEESDKILLEGLRKVKDGDEIEFEELDPAEVRAGLEPPAE